MLVRKAEGDYFPIEKVPKEKETLEGFIWKPKERPASKEEIIGAPKKEKKPAVSPKKPVVSVKKPLATTKKP